MIQDFYTLFEQKYRYNNAHLNEIIRLPARWNTTHSSFLSSVTDYTNNYNPVGNITEIINSYSEVITICRHLENRILSLQSLYYTCTAVGQDSI